MPELSQTVLDLHHEWGLDFTRARRVLTELAVGATVTQLVSASGLSRRDVESVLHSLSSFLMTDGERYALPALKLPETSHPDEATLTEQMALLAQDLPPSRWRLDHVPATAQTMARRSLYLSGKYDLDGASVLCLGDHDLTSLAVGLVAAGAQLTVVDIDEPILENVTDSAGRLGFPVTTAWADLRLGLPPSLVGSSDLAFTDPPYTTEGIRLFLTRALEALRPSGHERLAFCFGTGERHLVKALEVQSLLGDLRLALEAMLPGFNQYEGAEAIGARSDLYICRPTKGAKVGEEARSRAGRRRRGVDHRIYTRGPSAREAAERVLPDAVATAAVAAAGEGRMLLVGEGWDAADVAAQPGRGAAGPSGAAYPVALVDEESDGAVVPLPDFFSRVAVWATAARPRPFPFIGTPVINTAPDYGGAALRTLLLIAPERAVLVVPRRDLPDAALLGPAYDLEIVPAGPGGDPAVLLATRHDRAPGNTGEAVLRHVLLHPGAKVVNAWRDGLLAVARDSGQPMTKNDARARIAADTLPPTLRRLRTWELPQFALRLLVSEIARSTADHEAPK